MWLFVEGELADGSSVDLYELQFTPVSVVKPADSAGHFHGYRWRKYFNNGKFVDDWPDLATYYCRRWNARYPDTPAVLAFGFVLYERTLEGIHEGDAQWELTEYPLGAQKCE